MFILKFSLFILFSHSPQTPLLTADGVNNKLKHTNLENHGTSSALCWQSDRMNPPKTTLDALRVG